MLLDIYLFLAGISIVFIILSFFRRDLIVFAWFAALLCPILALISGGIETSFCAYDTAWVCHLERYESPSLMWFWFGTGFFMIAYAIVVSVWKPAEDLGGAEREAA